MKKIITIFLIFFVFTTGMIIPTKKADAITILGISGVADVVIDPAHIGTSVSGWIQEWSRFALEKGLEVVLATLKKRLLDRIVNQTIEWIQGNGSPRFVTDPGGFFRDAADAALGDTIQEVGLGDLCSSSLRTKIRVQLEQPTFRDQVSCTLSSAFGNVEGAVEQFGEDFRNGSWIAYNEVLKPQNNAFGLRIMTQMELAQRQSQEQQEAEQEISSGDGFLSQKICLKWEKQIDPAEGPPDFPLAPVSGENYYTNAPNESGTAPSDIRYTGNSRPDGTDWACTDSETITPGSTIADSVSKSIGSDIDFIVNSDDLSTYVSAIADALINRLTKEAVSGLAGVYNSARGSDPRGSTSSCEDLGDPGDPAREACENYSSTRDEIDDSADEGTEELENQRDDAQDSADRSGTIAACNDLPDIGDTREDCREQFKSSPNQIDVGDSHPLIIGTEHSHSGTTITSPGEDLESYAWSFVSCPGGSCPALFDNQGSLNEGENEVTIDGPTYTPNIGGVYELMIEVTDKDNDISTSTLIEDTYNLNIGSDHVLTVGVSHPHDNATVSNPDGELNSYFWTFNSCPGTCPSISGESGTINDTGATVSIPTATYTPNESGLYELVLEVTDSSGNSVTDSVIEGTQ